MHSLFLIRWVFLSLSLPQSYYFPEIDYCHYHAFLSIFTTYVYTHKQRVML